MVTPKFKPLLKEKGRLLAMSLILNKSRKKNLKVHLLSTVTLRIPLRSSILTKSLSLLRLSLPLLKNQFPTLIPIFNKLKV